MGFSTYVSLAIATPLALMVFWGGTADLLAVSSTQAALHTAAGIADRSMVADGCITSPAVQAIASTLHAAHLNPNQMTLQTTSSNRAYGSTGLGVTLTYHLPLTFPGTPWVVKNAAISAQVSGDQSQYVPYAGAASACASSGTVAAVFQGTSGSGPTLGSGATLPAQPTAITESVTPTTGQVGSPLTVAGVVSDASGPMAGVSVAINLGSQADTTATTNANGQYSATLTPTTAGIVPVGVTAGPATNTVDVSVNAPAPAAIDLTVPSTVTVGQAFSITGIVLTANGQPVVDGTTVTVSASGGAFPSQMADTVGGQFTVTLPGGVAQTGTYTITATAGSVHQTATMSVDPGAPQSVTLAASPTTVAAGQSVTFSGTVTGPDGTAPATGTTVAIQSPTDTQDALPTLSTQTDGTFSGTATLTLAGTQTVTATAGTAQSTPISVTVQPGSPAQMVDLTATPASVNQGATTILTGQVLDAYGNPEPANTSVTLTSSAWPSAVTTQTGSDGIFSAPVTFAHAGDQTVTVTAGAATGTVTVLVNAQGTYGLQAQQSSTTLTAGQRATVTWTVTDSQGQPVEGKTLTFAASPAQGTTLSTQSATTNSQGQATLTVTATQAGTLEVTATTNGVTGTAVWSVHPGVPATLVAPAMTPSTAQSTQDGGTVFPQFTGLIEDAYGNPIPGASLTVTGGWDPGATVTGTTAADGTFRVALNPVVVGGPYPPTMTVTDAAGSHTFTPSATLTVVKQLYTLVLSPTNGSATTPAGTPYGITATLTAAGDAPVANAKITFTVPSGDTSTTWSSDTSTPTPNGPTSITATTNSQGQATVEAAFEPNLGNQTLQATLASDNVVATLAVDVGPNQPATVTWSTPSPDPVAAGSSFVTTGTLMDSYGFPVAAGEAVTVAFASDPTQTWTTAAGGVIGQGRWFTPTEAGSWQVVIFNVDGTAYNQGSEPTLPDVTETVDPGSLSYFYPVLGPANNSNGSWLSGYSWTTSSDASEGPTNAYPTLSDPPTGGSTYSVAGIGYDAYGNEISGASVPMSCSASNGGSCPSVPRSASGSWQNIGAFQSGSYTLTFSPSGGTATHVTFTIPGLRGWTVVVGNGSTVIGSGGPGSTINLGTLSSGEGLNFAIEGLDENGHIFTGYTNNATNQEGVVCINATNGGVCPNGLGQPISATIPLGSGATPNGYTGWSGLTTFQPGTYTLSIKAGQYGDAGGQDWTPTWVNTHITFTVSQPAIVVGTTGGAVTTWVNGTEHQLGNPDGSTGVTNLLYVPNVGLLANVFSYQTYRWTTVGWVTSGTPWFIPGSYSPANGGEYTTFEQNPPTIHLHTPSGTTTISPPTLSSRFPYQTFSQALVAPNGTIAVAGSAEGSMYTWENFVAVDSGGQWKEVWQQPSGGYPSFPLIAYNGSNQLFMYNPPYGPTNLGTAAIYSEGSVIPLGPSQSAPGIVSGVVYDSALREWIVASNQFYAWGDYAWNGSQWVMLPGQPSWVSLSGIAYNGNTLVTAGQIGISGGSKATVDTWNGGNTWTHLPGSGSLSLPGPAAFAYGL